ncbi:MAG: tRNA (adenosine(37)-N6)-dimethylallyltransferase MiaA, partial [Coriobacteriales bacterium]|nr:tRNA (adenosine(37)-N6)-dimethylallyltransferase MiaA [Coriobacteriales bacterium]
CIDIVDPGTPFSAALYQREARTHIERLLAAGRTPVLVGGTGLYVRAALDPFDLDEGGDGEGGGRDGGDVVDEGDGVVNEGVGDVVDEDDNGTAVNNGKANDNGKAGGDGKANDDGKAGGGDVDRAYDLRQALHAQADELGREAFHALLAARDPQSAELIHPHNTRRVVRAFELLEQGTTYAEQHAGFGCYEAIYPTRFIGISVAPEVLCEVIERRVDAMMATGLLDEVRGLLAQGWREALTAQQAIGYKELLPVLDGLRSLEDALAEIKQSTRRYAKRQRTWFRRDPRIHWIDATEEHRALLADRLDRAGFIACLHAKARQLLP